MSAITLTAQQNKSAWINEWRALLQRKAQSKSHSAVLDKYSYELLQVLCETLYIVYQPEMYDEYISVKSQYANIAAQETRMLTYAEHSPLITSQVAELKAIFDLEQFSTKHKYTFHGDSIIEKISLASYLKGEREMGN